MDTKYNKISVPIAEVIQYTYFEAIPWYLTRIGSEVGEVRPSSFHFSSIHSNFQGIDARAEYIERFPIAGFSYLLLFCSVSRIFHGNNRNVYESVISGLGYSPIEGDWYNAEKFIEDELLSRMRPEDVVKVSLGTHRRSKV